MLDIKLPTLIDISKLDKAVAKAIEIVYIGELTKRTPTKTGFTAGSWNSISLGNFNYAIVNPMGDIVIFLEEGTKAHDIKPKTKKMLKFPIDKRPTLRTKNEAKQFAKNKVIFFFNKRKQAVLGYSQEGGKFFCYAKKIHHPGFAGKHFVRDIMSDEALLNRFHAQIMKSL